MRDDQSVPEPVDGYFFPRSGAKLLGFLMFNAVVFIFGLLLIWVKVTDGALDPGYNPKKVTWFGFVAGIGMVSVTPFVALSLIRSYRVNQRLVIASDRLQMVEHIDGEDVVILQIPFSNISKFRYEVTSSERRVGISLRYLDDPDTYARHVNFENNRRSFSWDYCIPSGFEGGPRAIANQLERAYEEWKSIELELE